MHVYARHDSMSRCHDVHLYLFRGFYLLFQDPQFANEERRDEVGRLPPSQQQALKKHLLADPEQKSVDRWMQLDAD